MNRLFSLLERQTRTAIVVLAFGLTAAVALAQRAAGPEINFSVFYLLPVALLAWFRGRREGLLGAGACAVVWYLMDRWAGHAYSHPAIAVWNAVVRGTFFGVVALTLARLRSSFEMERTVSRLKSDMLSVVSHEFANALGVVEMTGHLLRETEKGEVGEEREMLYAGLDQVQADLHRVVANFLNHARLESGRFDLRMGSVLLREVVQAVLSTLKPLIDHKRIDLRAEFPATPVAARADRDALALIMSNLVGNAVKYTPPGGRISVGVSADPALGAVPGCVVVWIQDSGIGIGPEERREVFTGFFRTDAAKKSAKGFGIGLKITRELLQAHGSELELESETGRGTKAWFRLQAG